MELSFLLLPQELVAHCEAPDSAENRLRLQRTRAKAVLVNTHSNFDGKLSRPPTTQRESSGAAREWEGCED